MNRTRRQWCALLMTMAAAVGAWGCRSSKASHATVARSPVPVPQAQALDVDDFARTLDAYVSAFGRHWGEAFAFTGYVAVARDGHRVLGRSYGLADRERGTVAGPDTPFRLASVSKSFTAIAIFQLEDAGLLRRSDSIRKLLPELPPFADSITIDQCLTHTSGIPDAQEDEALVKETGELHPVGPALARFGGQAPRFAAGERFEYSNTGYMLLAAIVERVSGVSYERYMQAHVFGPAGMTRTTTISSPPPPRLAVGYAIDDEGRVVTAPAPSMVTFGSGSVISTTDDLIAFDAALSAGRLLREASLRAMFAPDRDASAVASTPARYARGWFVATDAGHDVAFHPGGGFGTETWFSRVPDAKVTVIVLSNGEECPAVRVGLAAQAIALTGRSPPPVDERETTALDPSQLSALAGDYVLVPASRALARAKLSREADMLRGLTLSQKDARLFVAYVQHPPAEVFRAGDGTLFTKRSGVEIVPSSNAITLVWPDRGPLRLTYARLGTAVAATPADAPCSNGSVRVPGGRFELRGREESVASLCMDATEVTVDAWSACVATGACSRAPTTPYWAGIRDGERAKWAPSCNGARADRRHHPVNCVDHAQAAAFCHAQGSRLPTLAEWTWAARGGDEARLFSWGFAAPNKQMCGSVTEKREGTCEVGAFPADDVFGGVHDLGGDVAEWTATRAADDTPHVETWEMAGPGWIWSDGSSFEAGRSEGVYTGFRGPTAGFRCVR